MHAPFPISIPRDSTEVCTKGGVRVIFPNLGGSDEKISMVPMG